MVNCHKPSTHWPTNYYRDLWFINHIPPSISSTVVHHDQSSFVMTTVYGCKIIFKPPPLNYISCDTNIHLPFNHASNPPKPATNEPSLRSTALTIQRHAEYAWDLDELPRCSWVPADHESRNLLVWLIMFVEMVNIDWKWLSIVNIDW